MLAGGSPPLGPRSLLPALCSTPHCAAARAGELPDLSPEQVQKLRMLSIVALATQTKVETSLGRRLIAACARGRSPHTPTLDSTCPIQLGAGL